MQNNIHTCLNGEEEYLAKKTFNQEFLQRSELMIQILSIVAYIKDNSYLDKLIDELSLKEEII